ncbi:hypothetical protein AB1Y20_017764 [Prymnesium parvum]|uniref:Phosphoribulokinase/uridine kinase domain-containing protein n=1 Tax=Prymnesium parvum TaxID=97485 RepID=A0AB34JNF5_PRYPA
MPLGQHCMLLRLPLLAMRVVASGAASRSLSAAASATLDYVRQGPIWDAVRELDVPAEDWVRHGDEMVAQLSSASVAPGATPYELDEGIATRVYHLYLPIFFFCRQRVRLHQAEGTVPIIGLSAPQGCGKTTLVDLLTDRFAADGLMCAAVSFDDFYLTGAEQDAVAAANSENALLQVRGNAGTHDLRLGTHTLHALTADTGSEVPIPIPRYNKAARGGRGDRAEPDTWRVLDSRPDVVLFEGWMAGFSALHEGHDGLQAHPGLPHLNSVLRGYEEWHSLVDSWVVLAVDDPNIVFQWRLEAERAMRASGRGGMNDEQVHDFVSRYLPAYGAYLPSLYASARTSGVDGKPTLFVKVNEKRGPVFCHDG